MEQCTRTLGLNVGIPLVMIRNWILVEYSGINRSLYLSLNYLDCAGIWAGADEESRSRKNGEVSAVGENLEMPDGMHRLAVRGLPPGVDADIVTRLDETKVGELGGFILEWIGSVWWNKCWEIHGSQIVFLPWLWSRMLGMFYELASLRKAWDVELIFLIWVLVIWLLGFMVLLEIKS